jgi:ribosomal protein S18 acetylase RimI-like enzyme
LTRFRPYRNSDSPALAALWNRGAPPSAVARPLTVHEFDFQVVGGPCFEAAGLIVAEQEGRLIGFAHAGFGPETIRSRPLYLSYALGTVGMLVVEPAVDDLALEDSLLAAAERYLLDRGARVLYAGGQYPLNPFYWGVYGGSEWAGILGSHDAFHRVVSRAGYQPVSGTVLLEADLSVPEPLDRRGLLIRRQVRVEVIDDVLPASWWDNLAIGEFRPTLYRLLLRSDQTELARACTWDMAWSSRIDGRSRIGLIAMEVHPDHRRQGYGRFLMGEILKLAREQVVAVVAVQTGAANTAALGLYETLGFQPVETATLYRRPGETS